MKNATKTRPNFPTNARVKVNLDLPKSFIKDYLNKREQKKIALREFGDSSHSIKSQFELKVASELARRLKIDFNIENNQKDLKAEIRKVWNELNKKNILNFVLCFKGQKEVVVKVKQFTDFNESKAKSFLTSKQIESCVFKSSYIEVSND